MWLQALWRPCRGCAVMPGLWGLRPLCSWLAHWRTFSGIRDGRAISLARLRLVQSCLSSLKEGLDALESEGSCQMDAVMASSRPWESPPCRIALPSKEASPRRGKG